MVDLLALGYGLGMFAVVSLPGFFVMWIGYAWYTIQKQIRDLDTSDIASATDGLVEVRGEAKAVDGVGTLTPPLSEIESLAYEFRIEGYKPDADADNWKTVEEQRELQSLQVEDSTGTATVDPEKFELMCEEHAVVVEGREDAPEPVLTFLDEKYEHGDEVLRWRKTRFTEARIEPGEDALVVGYANQATPETPVAGATTHISKADISGLKKFLGQPLVLSDKRKSAVLDAQTTWAKIAIGFGIFWLFLSAPQWAPALIGAFL